MVLILEKEIEDVRGKILFFKHGKLSINLVEIKKGYARGGHYHDYNQEHIIISGKVLCLEENIDTKKECKKIIENPTILNISANTAHLLIALEDTLFIESFEKEYSAINYPKYRKIVKDRMELQI